MEGLRAIESWKNRRPLRPLSDRLPTWQDRRPGGGVSWRPRPPPQAITQRSGPTGPTSVALRSLGVAGFSPARRGFAAGSRCAAPTCWCPIISSIAPISARSAFVGRRGPWRTSASPIPSVHTLPLLGDRGREPECPPGPPAATAAGNLSLQWEGLGLSTGRIQPLPALGLLGDRHDNHSEAAWAGEAREAYAPSPWSPTTTAGTREHASVTVVWCSIMLRANARWPNRCGDGAERFAVQSREQQHGPAPAGPECTPQGAPMGGPPVRPRPAPQPHWGGPPPPPFNATPQTGSRDRPQGPCDRPA